MARRLRRQAPRLARLAVFLVIVAVGLELLLGKVVRAQVDGALLDLGAGLVQLAGGAGEDPSRPRLLELNGSQLRFETATRAEAVDGVLDDAETGCNDMDAGGGDRHGAPPARPERLLRGSDGRRGFVACISRPRARLAGERSGERAPRRAGSAYRYVYAQPGQQATQVVSFWTERELDLERLFPDAGDAPGTDAPGLPRPPGARRILSAREVGAAQQLTLYRSRGGEPGELESWYRARLARLGWRPLEPGGRKRPASGDRVLVVGRAGSIAALVFTADEAGGSSVAILTSLDQGARKGHGPT